MKNALYQVRAELWVGRLWPICAQCGRSMYRDADMHEAIITRRDIMGTGYEAHAAIMVPENCVLVHPGGSGSRCHSKAHSDKTQVIRHLIGYETYPNLIDWLDSMEGMFKSTLVDEKKRLVSQINETYFLHGGYTDGY